MRDNDPKMRRTIILSALAIAATLAVSMGAGYLNATLSRSHHHAPATP